MNPTNTSRCVFVCDSTTKTTYGYSAKFHVTCDKEGAYKEFFKATPSGTLEIATIKDARFEPGKSYQVDITEIVEEVVGEAANGSN